MSFLKKLFGGGSASGGGGSASASAQQPGETYKGFTIRPVLMKAGSEYQLAGSIEKEVDGEVKVHNFVRADKFGSRDEAESLALSKARQIIDEQGDKVFGQSWPAKH
jgi:hypothetical protein